MTTPNRRVSGAGNVRYRYRLRLSSTAERALLAEWDRCRWVWNECVAQSKAAHRAYETCGPARLDAMLTGWRADKPWLRRCASVPQQQTIRDFAKSRTKPWPTSLKDCLLGSAPGCPGSSGTWPTRP